MAYLAIKKVKGRYYGYMQESYREGGRVRTRTVEYLGAVEPAVAQQYQATRRQLAQADMKALVQSVRQASQAATRATEKPQEVPAPPAASPAPEPTPEPPVKRYQRMTVNGRPQLVDTKTGELIEPTEPEVITTKRPTPLRPFREALKFPADIGKHKVSAAALNATHRKFGKKLEALMIPPAIMPDVTIKYGHPDSLKRHRDGGYIVTVSRNPKRRYPIILSKLWQHYRQALSHGYLDAIRADRPELYAQLEAEMSHSHLETKRLLFEHIGQSTDGWQRIGLSLQLFLWNRLPQPKQPKPRRGRKPAAKTPATTDVGLYDGGRVNDWRSEASMILADVQNSKMGWGGVGEKLTNAERKHKAMITRKRNQIGELSKLEILAGKRRRILREIMATETKLASVRNLQSRVETMRRILEP